MQLNFKYARLYIKVDRKRDHRALKPEVPAVALIGPRQCGKYTLSKHLLQQWQDSVYLDLEKTSDQNKLRDLEAFFAINRDKLICLRIALLFSE